MPEVSVIIPLYNKVDVLKYTIASVREQTFTDFECIIVDDCSTDGSFEICKACIAGDCRFHLVRHKVNCGLPATRNTALLYASGEYVLFLDADDLISPSCIEERYQTIRANNYAHVAGSYSWHLGIDASVQKAPASVREVMTEISFQSAAAENPFVVHGPLTRRDIAVGVGGFDEELRDGAEDYAFWQKILRHGFVFVPTNTANACYRASEMTAIRSKAALHLDIALAICDSSHEPMPKASFYSCAHMPMTRPMVFYKWEERQFIRILHFFGMSLANNNDASILPYARYLPDMPKGFPFSISPVEEILGGVQRSHAGRSVDWDKYLLLANKAVADLLEHISVDDDSLAAQENKPDLYSPGWQREIDLLFLPHVPYHVETIKLLAPCLDAAGISFVIGDSTAIFRDTEITAPIMAANLPSVSIAKLCMGDFAPRAVCVFNDWEEMITLPAVLAANSLGIPSIGLVEGIQDYDDVDTGRIRRPYKSCSHVITPCHFDLKYFDLEAQHIYEGNIPRIQKLAEEQAEFPYSSQAPVLINSNFSYGVLADKREMFLSSAVQACRELGLDYAITRHPNDDGDFSAYKVTPMTMYEAIYNSSVFISRFGSGIIEALAMNRPVVYYNPHGEKVDKFLDTMGAFHIANSREELKIAIQRTFSDLEELKSNWPAYLNEHAGYKPKDKLNSYEAIVGIIREIVDNYGPKTRNIGAFGRAYARSFKFY